MVWLVLFARLTPHPDQAWPSSNVETKDPDLKTVCTPAPNEYTALKRDGQQTDQTRNVRQKRERVVFIVKCDSSHSRKRAFARWEKFKDQNFKNQF